MHLAPQSPLRRQPRTTSPSAITAARHTGDSRSTTTVAFTNGPRVDAPTSPRPERRARPRRVVSALAGPPRRARTTSLSPAFRNPSAIRPTPLARHDAPVDHIDRGQHEEPPGREGRLRLFHAHAVAVFERVRLAMISPQLIAPRI